LPAVDENSARSRVPAWELHDRNGRTIAQNLKSVKWNPDQDVVRPANKPLSKTGGVVGLKGNLAPEGAIVKVAGMTELKFLRPRRAASTAKRTPSPR